MDQNERKAYEKIFGDTALFYHRNLTEESKSYLIQKRRINEETINRFQIGFARGGLKEHLIQDLKNLEELCIRAGVLKKGESGEVKGYFFNRIVFPNIKRGTVVNFTSRGIDGRNPEYLHLPGEISHLYNEDALDQKELMITDGVPDCLTAIQAGYAAVAVLGANNFKSRFVQKFSNCEKIYICLDGDAAGAAGAQSIGALLPDKAYIVQFPDGLDLNDYFKDHSAEDFQRIVRSAEKVLAYLLNKIPSDLDKTALPGYLDPVLEILVRLSPQAAEHFLEHEIKRRFGLTAEETKAYRSAINRKRKSADPRKKTSFDQGEKQIQYLAKSAQLVDLVEHNGSAAYLIKSSSEILLVDNVENDGVRYFPPPKNQLPWQLPNGQRVLQEFENCRSNPAVFGQRLYDGILEYLKGVSYLPDEKYYDLLTCWCFHTYLAEGFPYSPILCFYTVPERGKSRTGMALIYLSYRGVHVESLREAYIIRMAENLGCSIFFDVKDIWKKAERLGSEDILLLMYEKGAVVSRVLYPEEGRFRDTEYFSIFGPTLIATNEKMEKILETRVISINMPQARRNFLSDVVPETALPLKERLIAWRGFFLGRPLPETEKPAQGRLGDILKPLYQIVRLVYPQKEQLFVTLVRDLV